jgi:hypothetical protein
MDDRSLFDPNELPEDLHEVIKPELAPGERLLWADRANARASGRASSPLLGFVRAAGFLMISAGCFAAFFGLLGQRFHVIEGATGMFGMIAGIIGFLILIGTLGGWISEGLGRALVKRRCYALTDRRAIVWNLRSGSRAVEVHSFHRGRVKDVRRVEYPDGSGDVIFALNEARYDEVESGRFVGVAEVRRVEDLVRKVLIVLDSQNVL